MESSKPSTLTVRYVDLGVNFSHSTKVDASAGFLKFLCVLNDLSLLAARKTPKTSTPSIRFEGLTLGDGPWQYRIATDNANKQDEWHILKTKADFSEMLDNVADLDNPCVEIQHSSRHVKEHPLEPEKKSTTPAPPIQSYGRVKAPPTEPAKKKTPARARPVPPEKPSMFAIWEQYRWPPLIVDSGIIHQALKEERLARVNFGKAPRVEAMDLTSEHVHPEERRDETKN